MKAGRFHTGVRPWAAFAVVTLTIGVLPFESLHAHELRPGYLELRELTRDTYDVLWKVPARGDRRLGLYVDFPDACTTTKPTRRFAGTGYVERWRVTCNGGLVGQRVHIRGLSAMRTDVLVRVEHLDGRTQTARLTADDTDFTVAPRPTVRQVALTYGELGVEHILSGIDHLLFVLALVLVTRGTLLLVKTVTSFTLAHSITLGAAALGFVHVPGPPVEAVIALSIVFVAAEVVHLQRGHPGMASRAPWLVALSFGLLHGFGFAGALSDIGLPHANIPVALLLFNVGVEVGQLAFIAVVLAVMWALRRVAFRLPAPARFVPAYAIGGIAMFWVIERVAAF